MGNQIRPDRVLDAVHRDDASEIFQLVQVHNAQVGGKAGLAFLLEAARLRKWKAATALIHLGAIPSDSSWKHDELSELLAAYRRAGAPPSLDALLSARVGRTTHPSLTDTPVVPAPFSGDIGGRKWSCEDITEIRNGRPFPFLV